MGLLFWIAIGTAIIAVILIFFLRSIENQNLESRLKNIEERIKKLEEEK